MYGLEPGAYAKKYSFWALEYVARKNDYYSFCKNFYEFQKSILEKYIGSDSRDDISLNNIQEYASENGIKIAVKDSKKICSALTKEYKLYRKYGYPSWAIFNSPENILKGVTESGVYIQDFYRGYVGSILIAADIEGKNNHPVRHSDYTDGKVLAVEIDLTKPTSVILKEIEGVVESSKSYVSGDKDFLDDELPPDYFQLLADKEAALRGSYKPESDTPRAIGLWLWDRVHKLGAERGAKIQAITEFEALSNFADFELGHDPDYYHWLRRTEACINAAEVLTFDKKKSEPQNRKCSSGTRKRKQVPGTKTAK